MKFKWVPDIALIGGARYAAIVECLAADIAAGRLRSGDRLPTHRALAERLDVTITTVTRAYAEAERRGLVTAGVGRGTFVRETAGDSPEAAVARPVEAAAAVNMAFDRPADGGPVVAAIARHIEEAGAAPRRLLLPSDTPGGHPEHCEAGAAWLARGLGKDADAGRIVLVAGTQHAIVHALRAAANAGDVVLCGTLVSYGMKLGAGFLGVRLAGVEMDGEGILPDALDAAIRRRAPKALYVTPTHNTPDNATMSAARREAIAEVCRTHALTVVEEDCYGFLEPGHRPLASLVPHLTIHFVSLSKSVSSSLPVAFVQHPARLVERANAILRATVYSTPPLMCEIAARMIASGDAAAASAWLRALARKRAKFVARALPGAARALRKGAHQLWLPVPAGWTPDGFVDDAARAGVRLLPGRAFVPDGTAVPDAVRVCFCAPDADGDMKAGIERLARMISAGPSNGG
jgi:DNA-binding transcriptional MocR family regulator